MTKFVCSPQSICFYELTVPQEIICWITMAIATANRVNPGEDDHGPLLVGPAGLRDLLMNLLPGGSAALQVLRTCASHRRHLRRWGVAAHHAVLLPHWQPLCCHSHLVIRICLE